MGRGRSDLQIELLKLACRGRGFVSYATARRMRFGKAAGSQVARTDISRSVHRLAREGLVRLFPKGIIITPAGRTWFIDRETDLFLISLGLRVKPKSLKQR
jgi:hypothetical protein